MLQMKKMRITVIVVLCVTQVALNYIDVYLMSRKPTVKWGRDILYKC